METKEQFSSKDFHQTFARPTFVKPEKLIHRNVEDAGVHNQFSTERKHPVFFVDLPSKNVSMTIGGLLPDQMTNRHRHTYETVLYVIEGHGYTEVEDERVEWKAGDAVYIPSWAWHRHKNLSSEASAKYIACENAPQLQNLGVALREEEGRDL
ncbi:MULTISPECIES: cupin domain-containing protein [Flavobacterium]|jgi:quercetin dioxygenase-like cupin family protein|uniref:Cupin domain-containing protein n=1 Tax=Flavobacterium cupriresistens TaxID=2893885 RepID=A0ABU4RCN1_9FLAO|nr:MULTISPECIES: cupin domain-containing protein [unclassified Flavobacterium]KLT69904.1 cupin [Flavobacterium sp. ABG]MDX6189753.1 cupin domain-containing protein [Flavobacterium sp. Fl-318]UFH40840.1 cupin domain-containing protein [Flavobacterium sp. F-323]